MIAFGFYLRDFSSFRICSSFYFFSWFDLIVENCSSSFVLHIDLISWELENKLISLLLFSDVFSSVFFNSFISIFYICLFWFILTSSFSFAYCSNLGNVFLKMLLLNTRCDELKYFLIVVFFGWGESLLERISIF